MIITIGRECGCDGDELGKMLAEKYGIPCYTKVELIAAAKKKGLYDRYPFYFGEKQIDSMVNPMAEDFREQLRKTPNEALVRLLGDQNCIVIGRASNYAFRDREDAVRLFLCGEKEQRIRRIMGKHQISLRKAGKLVEETDERRKGYHEYYTGEMWGYAGNYDLCLDVTRIGKHGVAEVLDAYLNERGLHVPESL